VLTKAGMFTVLFKMLFIKLGIKKKRNNQVYSIPGCNIHSALRIKPPDTPMQGHEIFLILLLPCFTLLFDFAIDYKSVNVVYVRCSEVHVVIYM